MVESFFLLTSFNPVKKIIKKTCELVKGQSIDQSINQNVAGLDSLETDVLNKKTKEWLNSIDGDLWNAVHKLVAKNFYLDKDDRANIHPDENGMLIFEVKQRTELFKVSTIL